jgi:acyl carrier protein
MVPESAVATQIRTALAEHLKRDVTKIRLEDNLRKDLGLDSLAMIELLFKIEETFDLEIPNEDLSEITTVGDVIAYMERRLGTVAGSAPAARATSAVKGARQLPGSKVALAAKRPVAAGRSAPKRATGKKKASRRA